MVFFGLPPQKSASERFALLLSLAEEYLESNDLIEIQRAYNFAKEAHFGQKRASGIEYIIHPVTVALYLTRLGMDRDTLIGALLHDVLEDTAHTKIEIEEGFGEKVAALVDGVSKLTNVKFSSVAEQQAENLRKMIVATVEDLRVIIIKLSDRLHNMQTLGSLTKEKRERIARETLDIYAPLAHRIGIDRFRLELEDLAFSTYYPMRYQALKKAVKSSYWNQRERSRSIYNEIESQLELSNIQDFVLKERKKGLYDIYRKMVIHSLPLREIIDIYGFRIILDRVDQCYLALGVVHNTFKPILRKFRDYIAIPKTNGYQSLHTTLLGPHGLPIEVQIRTKEMQQISDIGIAAEWAPKSGTRKNHHPKKITEWIENVVEWQNKSGDIEEFMENIKFDLGTDEIYVFTPRGEILALPPHSTVIDFAYRIHSDLGNRCISSRINRIITALTTRLQNGDTVEIITGLEQEPNPAWLDSVVTPKARTAIRSRLRSITEQRAFQLGKALLEKAIHNQGGNTEILKEETFLKLAKQLHKSKSFQALCIEIGLGSQSVNLVALALLEKNEGTKATFLSELKNKKTALTINESNLQHLSLGKCCYPIHGDQIIGIITSGRGLVIHRRYCTNLSALTKYHEQLRVGWASNMESLFDVQISIYSKNILGLLSTIVLRISQAKAGIISINMDNKENNRRIFRILLEIRDRKHLASIISTIRSIPGVLQVSRH